MNLDVAETVKAVTSLVTAVGVILMYFSGKRAAARAENASIKAANTAEKTLEKVEVVHKQGNSLLTTVFLEKAQALRKLSDKTQNQADIEQAELAEQVYSQRKAEERAQLEADAKGKAADAAHP